MQEVEIKKRFKKFIIKGVNQPLQIVPFHREAPVTRLLMIDGEMIPQSDTRVSVHFVDDLPEEIPSYCDLHQHDFDEINLVLSEHDNLVYKIQLEDEVYLVRSPSTVFIPKGVRHSSEVVSGKGLFICITLQGDYYATR